MKIAIAGAGIAGLATAIALEKQGMKADIYEAGPEVRTGGAGLGLGYNALLALDHLGLREAVTEIGRFMPQFRILTPKGKTIQAAPLQGTEASVQPNLAVHRHDLHRLLLAQLRHSPVLTGKRLTDLELNPDGVVLRFEDGHRAEADALIAADGLWSVVRKRLWPQALPRYAGYTCWRGVAENMGEDILFPSETWGAGRRFGVVPLPGNRVYWFACVNAAERSPQYAGWGKKELALHFRGFKIPVDALLDQTSESTLLHNDIHDLPPMPRMANERVVLIGDAGHATTPNLAQGACQALEDAAILGHLLKNKSPEYAFRAFEDFRRGRVSWITGTSRSLGRVAQWEHPLAMALRYVLFKSAPTGMMKKNLARLNNFSLPEL